MIAFFVLEPTQDIHPWYGGTKQIYVYRSWTLLAVKRPEGISATKQSPTPVAFYPLFSAFRLCACEPACSSNGTAWVGCLCCQRAALDNGGPIALPHKTTLYSKMPPTSSLWQLLAASLHSSYHCQQSLHCCSCKCN